MPNLKNKIIWAIDVYGDMKVQSSASILAKSLSLHNDVQIVYVHGSAGFPVEKEKVAVRFGLSHSENQLKKILHQLEFKTDMKPKILAHGSGFVRGGVKTLLSYAKKTRANSILVSTNARLGFMRYVLGSFAETLIIESTIPVMVVSPKAKIALRPGVILFPTDFSKSSWKAYQQVVSLAKVIGSKIKIFHQYQGEQQAVPSNVSYFLSDKWLKSESLLDKDYQKIKSKLSKWLRWTKLQNVKCDHTIKFGFKNIADAAIEQAKKDHIWMIAMATIKGPISSTFLGSNARWVVRSAQCPVWVLYVRENK